MYQFLINKKWRVYIPFIIIFAMAVHFIGYTNFAIFCIMSGAVIFLATLRIDRVKDVKYNWDVAEEYDKNLAEEKRLADEYDKNLAESMAKFIDPITTAWIERLGRDNIMELLNDPEKREAYAEANRKYIERVAEEKRLAEEYLAESMAKLNNK